jgi:hypothetical protein
MIWLGNHPVVEDKEEGIYQQLFPNLKMMVPSPKICFVIASLENGKCARPDMAHTVSHQTLTFGMSVM